MRILIITQSFVPVLGGLQTVVNELAQGLDKRGHEILVIANRYPRDLPPMEKIAGVYVRRWQFLKPDFITYIREKRWDLFVGGVFLFPYTLLRLLFLLFRFKPDLINLHFPDYQTKFIQLTSFAIKTPLVVSLHGDEIERWKDNAKAQNYKDLIRLREILKTADVVTSCSNYLLEQAIAIEPQIKPKSRVIYNGVDLADFKNIVCNEKLLSKKPFILSYGRFTYKKGFDLLIQAFSQIKDAYPDYSLILAGEGEQDILRIIYELGLNDRITLWGRANRAEIVALLNNCECFVIPSRQEPFGLVGLEGAAANVKIVSTNVGGLPEVLNGLGVPVTFVEPDADSLALGIISTLNYDWKISNNIILEKLEDNFSWNRAVDQYEELFREISG